LFVLPRVARPEAAERSAEVKVSARTVRGPTPAADVDLLEKKRRHERPAQAGLLQAMAFR
jgi:hypothetical protein